MGRPKGRKNKPKVVDEPVVEVPADPPVLETPETLVASPVEPEPEPEPVVEAPAPAPAPAFDETPVLAVPDAPPPPVAPVAAPVAPDPVPEGTVMYVSTSPNMSVHLNKLIGMPEPQAEYINPITHEIIPAIPSVDANFAPLGGKFHTNDPKVIAALEQSGAWLRGQVRRMSEFTNMKLKQVATELDNVLKAAREAGQPIPDEDKLRAAIVGRNVAAGPATPQIVRGARTTQSHGGARSQLRSAPDISGVYGPEDDKALGSDHIRSEEAGPWAP